MKYMSLDQRGSVQAEYVWIDAVGGTRSKTKVRSHPHFRPRHSLALGLIAASISPVHAIFLHATAPIRIT